MARKKTTQKGTDLNENFSPQGQNRPCPLGYGSPLGRIPSLFSSKTRKTKYKIVKTWLILITKPLPKGENLFLK